MINRMIVCMLMVAAQPALAQGPAAIAQIDPLRLEVLQTPPVHGTESGSAQTGQDNLMRLKQNGDGLWALARQQGTDNLLNLVQSGADNAALLEQMGDRNAMSAEQSGAGNRLDWRQLGSHLPDLHILQSGGQSLTITQY